MSRLLVSPSLLLFSSCLVLILLFLSHIISQACLIQCVFLILFVLFCLSFSILSPFLSMSPCLFSPGLILLFFFFSFLYNLFCFHLVSPFLMSVSCNLLCPSHFICSILSCLCFLCLIFLILPLSFLFLVSSSLVFFFLFYFYVSYPLLASPFFNSCLILSFFLVSLFYLSILSGVSFSSIRFVLSPRPFHFSSHHFFAILHLLSHTFYSHPFLSSFPCFNSCLFLSLLFISCCLSCLSQHLLFPFSHLDLLLSHFVSSCLFPTFFFLFPLNFLVFVSKLVFCLSISFHNFVFSNHQPFLSSHTRNCQRKSHFY